MCTHNANHAAEHTAQKSIPCEAVEVMFSGLCDMTPRRSNHGETRPREYCSNFMVSFGVYSFGRQCAYDNCRQRPLTGRHRDIVNASLSLIICTELVSPPSYVRCALPKNTFASAVRLPKCMPSHGRISLPVLDLCWQSADCSAHICN